MVQSTSHFLSLWPPSLLWRLKTKAPGADFVRPRSPSSERQSWNLRSSPWVSTVCILAATAWARGLAAKRDRSQSHLLSGSMMPIFVALLINGTKIASGESGFMGTEFCWVVLSSVGFCKTKPVGAISFAADIMPSPEDGRQQSSARRPESTEYRFWTPISQTSPFPPLRL